VGTGKYKDFAETRAAVEASGAQIVTVAIRRTNIGQDPQQPSLLDVLPPARFTILPNTAGCYNAEDAVRTLRLARELLDGHDLVKLEVLGDQKTLFPNMAETLEAAATLVKDGFKVMVYCSDDPIAAKQLEEIGCAAVMPLASDMLMVAPHLVSRIQGEKLQAPWERRILSPGVDSQMVSMLEGVVDGGTGVQATIPGYTVAGKTGTAQKPSPNGGYSNQYDASFIGFLPAENPQVEIMIVVDSPKTSHFGGDVAAPAFEQIGSWYANHAGIKPDRPVS